MEIMNNVFSNPDDMDPEKLKLILEHENQRANRRATWIFLGCAVLLVAGVVVSIPLIARLYAWGFGG